MTANTTERLQCHFCEAEIPTDITGMIAIDAGEVGEFYKPSDPDAESVLAHVDCLPGGLGFGGEGGEWEIA
jgi:hypothetical protein